MAKKTPTKKPKTKKPAERPVVYKEVSVEMLDGRKGSGMMNAEKAKDLLGWQTEEDAGENVHPLLDGVTVYVPAASPEIV